MIFGFGGGEINILMDKESFILGETITGTIQLETKKPIIGEELYIRLIGINYEVAEFDEGEFEPPEKTEFFNQKFTITGEQDFIPEDTSSRSLSQHSSRIRKRRAMKVSGGMFMPVWTRKDLI